MYASEPITTADPILRASRPRPRQSEHQERGQEGAPHDPKTLAHLPSSRVREDRPSLTRPEEFSCTRRPCAATVWSLHRQTARGFDCASDELKFCGMRHVVRELNATKSQPFLPCTSHRKHRAEVTDVGETLESFEAGDMDAALN